MKQKRILGVSEVAELAGVSRACASHWRIRHADFPPPLEELKSGPIWHRRAIVKWLKSRNKNYATSP